MHAPPPCYWELANTVEQYLTNGSNTRNWTLDALEDGDANRINAYPFVKNNVVGVHVTYESSMLKSKISVNWSSITRDYRDLLPLLNSKFRAYGAYHSVEVATTSGETNYACVHPAFFITATSSLYSPYSLHLTSSTRLWQGCFGGVRALYDAKRSGLITADIVAVQRNCYGMYGGDVMLKYNLRKGLSISARVPVHEYVDVGVIGERDNCIVGLQGRSPCGARMMFNVNLSKLTYTINMIRNFNDIWKVTMSYTNMFQPDSKWPVPKVGVKFTNQDMPDYTFFEERRV